MTNLTLTILNAIKDEDVSPIYMPEVSSYTGILENLLMIEGLGGPLPCSGHIGILFFSHKGLGPVNQIPDVATKPSNSG